jgi:hypothetical protein
MTQIASPNPAINVCSDRICTHLLTSPQFNQANICVYLYGNCYLLRRRCANNGGNPNARCLRRETPSVNARGAAEGNPPAALVSPPAALAPQRTASLICGLIFIQLT